MFSRSMVGLAAMLVCSAAEARDGDRPRVTLYLEWGEGRALAAGPVLEGVRGALARRAEYRFTSVEELLEPVAAADAMLQRSVEEGIRGRAHLDSLEVAEGLAALRRAVTLAEGAFSRLAATPDGMTRFANLLLELAFAHHLADEAPQCQAALSEAFAVNPTLEFDRKRFPPAMRRVFESTRLLLDELGPGDLRVATVPAGATVRVNGVLMGYGPVTALRLLPATSRVTVSHPGYRSITRSVPVESGKQSRVSFQLTEHAGNLAGLLHAALREAQGPSVPVWLPQLCSRLQRDLLFVGTVAAHGAVAEVSLQVYDASTRQITGRIRSKLSIQDADGDGDSLITSLVARMGATRSPSSVTDRRSWLGRFYRSPYFWPVIGGVLGAAAVGTGVGLGVYYGTRGHDRERLLITLF